MQNIKREYSYTINENNYPEPNSWQRQIQALEELDCASGVCWHSSKLNKQAIHKSYSQTQKLKLAQRVVASWYVQMDGKYVDTANKNTKFSVQEILKLIPIRLAETFPNDALIEENINKFAEAAMFGTTLTLVWLSAFIQAKPILSQEILPGDYSAMVCGILIPGKCLLTDFLRPLMKSIPIGAHSHKC